MHRAKRTIRRGFAMVLVLISLATASILTVAYLASRDNSAAIGENVVASSGARWAASSGLELGVAILQTEADWRTLHTDGKLLDDFVIGQGTIDLDLLDLETGTPPTAESTHLRLIATATVLGVEQVGTAEVTIQAGEAGEVDLDLSEFAIFAGDRVQLDNEATITRWPMAPLSDQGKRIAMGTQGTGTDTIKLTGNAAAIDTTVYYGPDASSSLVDSGSGPVIQKEEMLDSIPMPEAPDPGVVPPHPMDSYPYIPQDYSNFTLSWDFRAGYVDITNWSTLVLDDGVELVVNHDLLVKRYSRILVDGDARLVVFGTLELLDNGSIELTDGSSLELFVGEQLRLNDGYIGDERPDSTRDNSGNAPYIDPQQVAIYNITEWVTQPWLLEHNSVIKGAMYAPQVDLIVKDDSAMYGCVAVDYLNVKDNSAVFYDHMLDNGVGYTNPNSALYGDDGYIVDVFVMLTSMSPTELQAAADAAGVAVHVGDRTYGDLPTATDAPVPGESPIDPTPRPIGVEYDIVSFGTDMLAKEEAVAKDGLATPLTIDKQAATELTVASK